MSTDRIEKILTHSLYRECLEKLTQTEESRLYCKHNLTHFLDTARIAYIYCLENNITNENGEIKTGDITRNVWVVDVKHNKEAKPKDAEIETVKKLYNKKYYIDATTGEIIGGEQSEYFNN